jgi:hypothetical protein
MICRNFELAQPEVAGPVWERFVFTMMPSHSMVYLSSRG